jgi:hypothetical protein
VNTEAIQADYRDGVLTLSFPKREEAKQAEANQGKGRGSISGSRSGPLIAIGASVKSSCGSIGAGSCQPLVIHQAKEGENPCFDSTK